MTNAGDRARRCAVGEERAAQWYRAHGYEVIARNWRCREGEIDLVCRRRTTIVICEVKSRSSTRFGFPEEAVTRAKRSRLRRLAAAWLAHSRVRCDEVRFDVVSVLGREVEVFEAAF